MSKKNRKPKEPAERTSSLRADNPDFQQKLWTALTDYERLESRCTAPVESFVRMVEKAKGGQVFDTKLGPLCYIDRGSDVLTVAHLDAVGSKTHFGHLHFLGEKTIIFSPWLDDRLGVFIILDVLPRLGYNCDILLCTNEEKGESTAQFFEAPEGKHWRYLAEFDRMGEDIVTYDYRVPEMNKALVAAGFSHPSHGAYTDIASLYHLGVGAFNVGVGYESPHTNWCKAELEVTFRQLVRYLRFAEANAETTFPFEQGTKWSRSRQERQRTWTVPTSTNTSTGSNGTAPSAPVVTHHYPPSNVGSSRHALVTRFLAPPNSPAAFEFYPSDWVQLEDDEQHFLWQVSELGAWDGMARCYEWSVRRTLSTGAVIVRTVLEKLMCLPLALTDSNHTVLLYPSKWIRLGRPVDWRHNMVRRFQRLVYARLHGKPLPEAAWKDAALLRWLWESHLGLHHDPLVRLAREEYEDNLFAPLTTDAPEVASNSSMWPGHLFQNMPFHYNDLVLVDGWTDDKGQPRSGVVAALYPVILTDDSQWWWVDSLQPDDNGMSLSIVNASRLTKIASGHDRFGLYRPEDNINFNYRLTGGTANG